jgi:predicted  nucleic acid-binding Zn-ribbon protein
MAENLTIEEIQRSFARFKDDIDAVEVDLRDLLSGFEREARGAGAENPERRRELEREIQEAKRAVGDLVRRIAGLERRIAERDERPASRTAAVEGGSDLY